MKDGGPKRADLLLEKKKLGKELREEGKAIS